MLVFEVIGPAPPGDWRQLPGRHVGSKGKGNNGKERRFHLSAIGALSHFRFSICSSMDFSIAAMRYGTVDLGLNSSQIAVVIGVNPRVLISSKTGFWCAVQRG